MIEQAITPYKNLLELYIAGERESFRLIFSSSPGNMALFLDTYRPGKKANRLLFFESIYNVKVTDIQLADKDRIISLVFENGDKLLFKLFSNKANALLISNGLISETFKDFDEIGNPEPTPKTQQLFSNIPEQGKSKAVMLAANPLLPRAELEELIRLNRLDGKTPEEIVQLTKKVTGQIAAKPVYRKLDSGIVTLINEELLPLNTQEEYESVNDLISYRFRNYAHYQRLNQQKGSISKAIKRDIKRLNSSLRNLSKADKGIEKAETYEKYGHLLMANAHLEKPQTNTLTVSDLYDGGKEIQIKVDPELTVAENAEHYYNRSSSALKSYKEAEKRTPKLEERHNRLLRMEQELKEISHLRDLDDWKKEHQKEIGNLGFGKSKKQESALPFHTLELNGYQIWIGKNAKSNDKIVQLSHKEDVWMHARGVPGSHLVVRMENNKEMPSKETIARAASFAAYNSKAKGAKLVPVIFTKRKYVRKPKGAAPGTVLVQKEEVELVKPEKPEV
ncbi:MAG: DUF814 domain-containing protein [Balneolaceae bacterium]|nr:DUF814 domain-containing protein [Balneolaceae bacterium]